MTLRTKLAAFCALCLLNAQGQEVKRATADPPPGYKQCAVENGSFTFNQKVDVAYGSNGHFVFKEGLTGKVSFSNAAFGDPRPGYAKYGFYRLPVNSGSAAEAKPVVPEGIRGKMNFRYADQVTPSSDFKDAGIKPGDRIYVLPNQKVNEAFLEKRLGEDRSGRVYFGKTGLSFDPNAPKICGQTFTVASIDERTLRFNEKFPENMRNDWNSSFSFEVILIRPTATNTNLIEFRRR